MPSNTIPLPEIYWQVVAIICTGTRLPIALRDFLSTAPLVYRDFLITGHYDGLLICTNLKNFKQQLLIQLKEPVDLLFLDGDLLLVVSGKQLVAIPVTGN